jgi:hypothetical protein
VKVGLGISSKDRKMSMEIVVNNTRYSVYRAWSKTGQKDKL